jgi:hypothetical protein
MIKAMNKRGFAAVWIVLIVVIVLAAAAGGVWYWKINKASVLPVAVNSASSTAPAGNNSTSSQTTETLVPAMSRYTDSDFGFSFYYPTSWMVQQATTSNPDFYAGGSIKKTINISGNDDGVQSLVEIDEYYSDERTITVPEDMCPAGNTSNPCPAQRLYFDANTHTWMIAYPDGDSDGVYGTKVAADVSTNTMGGLHLIHHFARFDSLGIIPLSAEKFLVVSSAEGGILDQFLPQTIAATDPSVATPVSTGQQQETVYKEALQYGAAGKKVGNFFYVDDQHVYDGQFNIITGLNPATFKVFTQYSDGWMSPGYFYTDGMHVWYDGVNPPVILTDADPATFVMIRQAYQIPYATSSGKYGQSFTSYDTTYEKDKSHVWDGAKLVPGADPKTFIVIGEFNPGGNTTLAHDANHTYGEDAGGNITIDGVTISE